MRRFGIVALAVLGALGAGAAGAAAAPPGAPVQLGAAEGSAWQPENGFRIQWVNPEQRGAGITRARYRVLGFDSGIEVGAGSENLGDRTSLGPVAVPGPGAFTVEVRLEDLAGAVGPPATTVVRFDDGRPGNVDPVPVGGWLSADEFPHSQRVSDATPGGPSGVIGYALTISGDATVRPCPAGLCGAGELAFTGAPGNDALLIGGLPEGSHWVSAVAVSGSGLASPVPGRTLLRVDRTAPASTVAGVPSGWVREPVTVEVSATDSRSGMVPAPGEEGSPVTAVQAGELEPRVAQGDSVGLRVSEEGVTRVRYWARDLAGNVNDGGPDGNGGLHGAPGEALVRIDRRAPVVTVEERRDPADPELLRATVRDPGAGLADGEISYRRVGQAGEFNRLPTGVADGTLTARLPSDTLEDGRYEIRANAVDGAGNRGTSTDAGDPTILELPLKSPVRVSLEFAGSEKRRARIERGPLRVRGRVTGTGGRPFARVPVSIEETFRPGSRRSFRERTVVTGAHGRFTAVLRPGPSRTVAARFGGTRTDRPARSRGLSVVASDRVLFHVTPALLVNGGSASMSGRVTGRGAVQPPGGKLVAIQYFDPARDRWRPVEVIRADRRGRFRYRYRFRTISYAQKILFRAVSLPEAGWPFGTTASARRPVVVYPSG